MKHHPHNQLETPKYSGTATIFAVLGSLATSMRSVLVRSVTFGAAAGADGAATFDQSPDLAVTAAGEARCGGFPARHGASSP